MTLVPATQDVMRWLEELIDHCHDRHPVMQISPSVAVTKVLLAVENCWRAALWRSSSNPAALDGFALLTRATLALDQCLSWISTPRGAHTSSHIRLPTDEEVDEFIQLSFSYVLLCVLFTAWHRGVITDMFIDHDKRFLQARLPMRLSVYHLASMQLHHAPTFSDAESVLKSSRSEILSNFAGDLSTVPMPLWQPAFEALYRVVEFDWDVDWAGDVGGFTMLDARRAAVTLRLWSELMIFSSSGLTVGKEKDLAGLLARYSALPHHVATALVRDMAFDIGNPRGDAASFPLIRLSEGALVTWSPTKAFITNHHRELLRRLSVRDRATHNRISDVKHDVLIQQLSELVDSYAPRLSFLSKVTLNDTDIDAIIVDNDTGTYLCLEVKAYLSPSTLREAFDIDARRSKDGRLKDGLLKGSSVQIPKILRHASANSEYFFSRIKVFAHGVTLSRPRRVFGAVLSAWTFGTGEADGIELQDIPHQQAVRVVTLPLLRQLLAQSSGDLEQLYELIARNDHLAIPEASEQRVTYGDWTFEWQYG